MTESRTGKLVDARWERLQELFSRAVEMPPAERETFIARETADDASMRDELIELLACDRRGSTGPLTQALGAALDATSRDRRKALVGRVVGNYKLVSVLGHGGTGTVYLGERADRQYSAQVAVKIVDTGQVHGDLGLRFRAERQILASLNHANIARLLDAGETQEGQPFLVMEYVHGEPLDRYCDRQQLDVRARLQLFVDICSAVQYAHQNLIVHRDLKPANILVTSEGAPKLLDFGIAKLLDAGEAASVLALTRMNDRLLTPEYASPEQILGRSVTTASDVYALGVVLYELLTGLRPYVVPASASQLELERSICVTDPMRPSAAVRRAMENGPVEGQSEISAVAAARGLTPDKLHRRLIGDIDSIVMRALRKEPQHRYSSVEQLASDVRRYLTREPVMARQGNWIYYSQRFIRRHAFGASAGATFVAFVIAFAVAMSIQTQRIAQERDRAAAEGKRAETVSDFMIEIFSWSEPTTHQGRAMTARELLDSAGTRIRGDLQQQPEVRARLLEAIGRAYRRQNEYERAITYLEDALRVRREMPDADGRKTANVLTELAIALRMSGDFVSADRTLKQALALTKQHADDHSETYARLLTNLGRGQTIAGNLPQAKQYLEESLKLNRELFGPGHPEVATVLLDLSDVFLWEDDMPKAEKAVRQAIDIWTASGMQHLHPDMVMAKARLGEVLLYQNRVNEAEPIFVDTLAAMKTLYGPVSRRVAEQLDSLSLIKRGQGSMKDAEDYALQALTVNAAAMGEGHHTTAYFRTSYAAILFRRAKFKEAEKQVRQSLEIYERTLPPDHQYVASSEHLLGEILLATHRLDDAEAYLTAAMNRWRRIDSAPWRAARSESALGEALYRQGRIKEAEKYLVESYTTLAEDERADRDARVKSRERVQQFYNDRGQREKFEALMLATNQSPQRAEHAPN